MTTDKYKGVAEIEILGEKHGFKFGIAAMAQLCELEGKPLAEVIKLLDDPSNLKTQINFYYAAAVQFARLVKKDDQFFKEPTFEEVANWIDCISADIKEKLNETAFAQYSDPNLAAPVSPGQ